MFILHYKSTFNEIDLLVEKLQINDIFDSFYESPLEITTDDYGYGYNEDENKEIILKVAFTESSNELENFKNKVNCILNKECILIEEESNTFDNYDFPIIDIDENWVIASPDYIVEDKNKINFISQGAFGTGLHETTQDILKVILTKLDLKNKSVLDIGTGSGILSIASSLAGAKNVTAVDIRDVYYEVSLNASLNNLENIDIVVGNILDDCSLIKEKFDWIFINIGGEETKLFMDFISKNITSNHKILVSGLVEWSFDEIKTFVEKFDFKLSKKYQTNEWVTAIFE